MSFRIQCKSLVTNIRRRGSSILVSFLSITVCILLFQNCGAGFDALSSDHSVISAFASIDQGKMLYKNNCSSCHGQLDTSVKLGRDLSMINGAISSIPQMAKLSFLTQEQRALIAQALNPPSSGPVIDPNGRQIFSCTPGSVPKTPVLKLSNREFATAIKSLLDDFSGSLKNDGALNQMLSSLPGDVLTEDRDTLKEQSLLVTQSNVNATFEIAFRSSFLITTDNTGLQNYPNTNGCLANSTITQACHKSFVKELASRAFRRPVAQPEADTLATNLFDSSLTKTDLLQLTFTSIVSMPDFSYKIYDGGSLQNGTSVLSLNASELAAKLSFFLTGAPPDSILKSKAATGQILNASILSQEIDRLMATPAARATIQRLFRESYGYDYFTGWNYDFNYTEGKDMSYLQQSMSGELDDYFSSIVLDQRGSFNDLMTSTQTKFTHSTLAYIYGVGSASVTNLPPERAGFLNRAAMLTKRSGYLTSPIKRGLKVLEHVLCQQVGNPPPNAPTSLPEIPAGQYMTVRDRTHALSEAPGSTCITCHSKINNLGYQFEKFDSFGRLRSVENEYNSSGQVITTLPINTSTTTAEVFPPNQISTQDSLDLTQRLGVSDRAMMCFAQHLKRFESRLPASSDANCHMNKALEAMYGSGGSQGSIVDAIKAYVMSPEFRSWNFSN